VATGYDNLRLIGQLSTVGLSFVLALVMGFGGGYLLDGWLGTSPWLAFIGFFVGLAAGVLNVYRIMGAIGKTPGSGVNNQQS
jgi:ATP synthase protein I